MLVLLVRTSFGHLLLSIFLSSFTHITNHNLSHVGPLWAALMYCIWYPASTAVFLTLRVLVLMAYQPYARAPNTYWNYIFIFKLEQISYLFSLKNYCPYRDLNLGPCQYQADMLPIELSWPG